MFHLSFAYQSPYWAASCDEKEKQPILSFPDIPTRLQAYTGQVVCTVSYDSFKLNSVK